MFLYDLYQEALTGVKNLMFVSRTNLVTAGIFECLSFATMGFEFTRETLLRRFFIC